MGSRRFLRSLLYVIVSLIAFYCLVYAVAAYAVDVPYWDQWSGLLPLIEKSNRGILTLRDIWWQHNEHRLLFPRIIMIGLARLTSWDIRYELALNVLLAVGSFFTLNHLLSRGRTGSADRLLTWASPMLALMVFSLSQWENWLW